MNKQALTIVRSAIRSAEAYAAHIIALRAEAHRDNVLHDAKALRDWLRPMIAVAYGYAVDTQFTRDMPSAPRVALSRMAKAVMGDALPQREVKHVRIPRELAASLKQLLATYDAATVRAALKQLS